MPNIPELISKMATGNGVFKGDAVFALADGSFVDKDGKEVAAASPIAASAYSNFEGFSVPSEVTSEVTAAVTAHNASATAHATEISGAVSTHNTDAGAHDALFNRERKNIWTATRGNWIGKKAVVWTDDDGGSKLISVLDPMYTGKGVPLCVALYPQSTVLQNKLNTDRLLELQNSYGWEILSHNNEHVDMNTFAEEQLRAQSRAIIKLLTGFGFDVQTIMYPYGSANEMVRSVCQEYYRSGATSSVVVNPVNDMRLTNLYFLKRAPFAYDNTKDFAYYKAYIDELNANGGLLIFIHHANDVNFDAGQIAIWGQVVDYYRSLGIPDMTMKNALDYFAPVVQAGDYPYTTSATSSYFKLLKTGEVISNHAITHEKTLNKYPVTTPPSGFVNPVTVFSIDSSGGYPVAGTVVTIKGYGGVYDKQVILPYNDSAAIQVRSSTADRSGWGSWTAQKIATDWYYQLRLTHSYVSTTLASGFPGDKITSFYVSSGIGWPDGATGIVTVYNFGGRGMQRQEFRKYNSNSVYSRFSDVSTGEWTAWEKISAV